MLCMEMLPCDYLNTDHEKGMSTVRVTHNLSSFGYMELEVGCVLESLSSGLGRGSVRAAGEGVLELYNLKGNGACSHNT
jgi:hypothetical protein